MKAVHMVASVLVWIGGINWGLVGLSGFFQSNWNVVDLILYKVPTVELSVYVLVGVSAVYLALTHKKTCKDCMVEASQPTM